MNHDDGDNGGGLEKFEHWNQTVLTKIICVQYHQDNYLLINIACRQDARVR